MIPPFSYVVVSKACKCITSHRATTRQFWLSLFIFICFHYGCKWAREFHSLPSPHVLKPYSNEAWTPPPFFSKCVFASRENRCEHCHCNVLHHVTMKELQLLPFLIFLFVMGVSKQRSFAPQHCSNSPPPPPIFSCVLISNGRGHECYHHCVFYCATMKEF